MRKDLADNYGFSSASIRAWLARLLGLVLLVAGSRAAAVSGVELSGDIFEILLPVTAGGITSGLDLALWIVEHEFGAKLANAVAETMEYPRTGNIWRAGAVANR